MFPYSEPVFQNPIERGINYINNSVKVVINAYNGNVSFYVINPKGSFDSDFRKTYPQLFKPYSAMPDFLKAHIRYPTDLFSIQTKMFNVYHMTDPKVFYNQEDYWQFLTKYTVTNSRKCFPIILLCGYRKPKKRNSS